MAVLCARLVQMICTYITASRPEPFFDCVCREGVNSIVILLSMKMS